MTHNELETPPLNNLQTRRAFRFFRELQKIDPERGDTVIPHPDGKSLVIIKKNKAALIPLEEMDADLNAERN